MSTVHQRQASHAAHADVSQEGPVTSGQVAFSVEPSTAHDREEQEIHETLQQCQGMIGAHEITPWRSQITVSALSACLNHWSLARCTLDGHTSCGSIGGHLVPAGDITAALSGK